MAESRSSTQKNGLMVSLTRSQRRSSPMPNSTAKPQGDTFRRLGELILCQKPQRSGWKGTDILVGVLGHACLGFLGVHG